MTDIREREASKLLIDAIIKSFEVIEARAQVDSTDDVKELRRQMAHIRGHCRRGLELLRESSAEISTLTAVRGHDD